MKKFLLYALLIACALPLVSCARTARTARTTDTPAPSGDVQEVIELPELESMYFFAANTRDEASLYLSQGVYFHLHVNTLDGGNYAGRYESKNGVYTLTVPARTFWRIVDRDTGETERVDEEEKTFIFKRRGSSMVFCAEGSSPFDERAKFTDGSEFKNYHGIPLPAGPQDEEFWSFEDQACYVFHDESAENELLADQTYLYLHKDHSFSFHFAYLSSHIGFGTAHASNGVLTLRSSDGQFIYKFRIEENALVFLEKESSSALWMSNMTDGSRFELTT